MSKPLLYDVFSGAGGAAKGYMDAGFRVVGVDNKPQPRYHGDRFIQMDAFEFFAQYMNGQFEEAAAFHCSPPCQGYTIMHNLPWLRGREYPLLILPTIELLERIGKPYVLENVMGARHGAKGLAKRGLEAHGLQAGWLCGRMFGLPFYRHRLFATNWFWLAPGHPKHQVSIRPGHSLAGRARDIVFVPGHPRSERWVYGGTVKGLPGGAAGLDVKPSVAMAVRPQGNFDKWRASGDPMAALMGKMATLGKWQNGAQAEGVGVGHAKGWRLAAEAMGIDWMTRDELTQAIPPAYTEHIGKALMARLAVRT